ncbi:uncharacterized protein LOC111618542 [Centruroides sculpturatus]|uniref:uncharacterized protein LOC111618542 n=1 Tax=Centruroides sculpturatus TaxID=218467 RepID=UPI000C6CC1C4|nr:uncharacterized protein LOC111618542 [Centruroides sculpturatus]
MGILPSKDGVKLPTLSLFMNEKPLNDRIRKQKCQTRSYLSHKIYKTESRYLENKDNWKLTQVIDANFYFKPNSESRPSFHSMKSSSESISYVTCRQTDVPNGRGRHVSLPYDKMKYHPKIKRYVREIRVTESQDEVIMPEVRISEHSTALENDTSALESCNRTRESDSDAYRIEAEFKKRRKPKTYDDSSTYEAMVKEETNDKGGRNVYVTISEEKIMPVI